MTMTPFRIFSLTLLLLLLSLLAAQPALSAGEVSVTIGSGRPETISITTVPSGATIYLNGVLQTVKSDGELTNLPQGIHIIRLTLPGYYDFEKIVDVSSRGTTYVTYRFEKKENSVRISSDPAGAAISIDGVYRGKTDLTLTLAADQTYAVRLSLEGYCPHTESLILRAKTGVKDQEGIHHTFVPMTGSSSLRVSTIPPGAAIFIDGNSSGTSDTVIREILPGIHDIRLTSAGFNDYTGSVTVSCGSGSELNVTLLREGGMLLINSAPVNASVSIDGSPAGKTPFADKVPEGKHRIELAAEAFERSVLEIDLGPQGQTLNFILIPLAQKEILVAEKKIADNQQYSPAAAQEALDQGKRELVNGEYAEAYESLAKAGKLAEDVDDDGIPNRLDLQPGAKDTTSYLLLAAIVLALAGILYYDWRRCSVVPSLDLGFYQRVDVTRGKTDTVLTVTISVQNAYQSLHCPIFLDDVLFDSLSAEGGHKVSLGHLEPGDHTVTARLFVRKRRYGYAELVRTLEFESL